MRAQPAIVGNTLFLSVGENAKLFALDISGAKPCVQWTYESDVPRRSGISFGDLPGTGRKVITFNDVATQVHLVDASTGQQKPQLVLDAGSRELATSGWFAMAARDRDNRPIALPPLLLETEQDRADAIEGEAFRRRSLGHGAA
jgi:hypothetical protein